MRGSVAPSEAEYRTRYRTELPDSLSPMRFVAVFTDNRRL